MKKEEIAIPSLKLSSTKYQVQKKEKILFVGFRHCKRLYQCWLSLKHVNLFVSVSYCQFMTKVTDMLILSHYGFGGRVKKFSFGTWREDEGRRQ